MLANAAPSARCSRRRLGYASAALVFLGCGGGSPLLHGAHSLPNGAVALGGGFSSTFATGDASSALRAARAAEHDHPSSPDVTTEDRQVAAAAQAVMAAMSPSVAPWVSARFGLPSSNEAGLAYSGRSLRVDARHSFETESLALSIGAGASLLLPVSEDDQGTALSTSRFAVHSVGFDVPVLLGWRSSMGVISLWGGGRAGFERIRGDASIGPAEPPIEGSMALQRWYAGAVIGFSLGFRRLHGNIELDADYQHAQGTLAGLDVQVSGVTLTPAAALVASF